jgi:phosphopantothenoylcysteine decarboxylase/phosphopantothenate--cysteine ligase
MITLLAEKRLVLGVTGSIASYKAADLASKLTQVGALVDVILTEAAQRFITPLTFQALTGRPVYTDLWESGGAGLPTHIAHVGLAESAEAILIAPCTAQTLAKLAGGFADDLLTITVLAARCPVLVFPAMDGGMYEHPATQANVRTLRERGLHVLDPDFGRFASGLEGRGRLPETPQLLGELRRLLGRRRGALRGRQVVITAGGTREALDPVRFISNHSSGKQGYALAQAALDAGAEVTLISSVNLPTPVGATLKPVTSAQEMRQAVLEAVSGADVLIMAAAVADYRPQQAAEQKMKKTAEDFTLTLTRNPDILAEVGAGRRQIGRPYFVVGFAAETQDVLAHAQAKLEAKNADMLVANDITEAGAGFGTDTNRVTLLFRDSPPRPLPLLSKTQVAEAILHEVTIRLNSLKIEASDESPSSD